MVYSNCGTFIVQKLITDLAKCLAFVCLQKCEVRKLKLSETLTSEKNISNFFQASKMISVSLILLRENCF